MVEDSLDWRRGILPQAKVVPPWAEEVITDPRGSSATALLRRSSPQPIGTPVDQRRPEQDDEAPPKTSPFSQK